MRSHPGGLHLISGETHASCWSHRESHLSHIAPEKVSNIVMSQHLNARVIIVKMYLFIVA